MIFVNLSLAFDRLLIAPKIICKFGIHRNILNMIFVNLSLAFDHLLTAPQNNLHFRIHTNSLILICYFVLCFIYLFLSFLGFFIR